MRGWPETVSEFKEIYESLYPGDIGKQLEWMAVCAETIANSNKGWREDCEAVREQYSEAESKIAVLSTVVDQLHYALHRLWSSRFHRGIQINVGDCKCEDHEYAADVFSQTFQFVTEKEAKIPSRRG